MVNISDGDYTEISGSKPFLGIDLLAGYFTDLEALYIELGFAAGNVDVAIGYGEDQLGMVCKRRSIVNMSFSGSREIQISDSFATEVFQSFIINPEADTAFLVFGISF